MKTMRIQIMILAVLLVCAAPVTVLAASQMANLENALMCKCDDKCGKVLINCTCDTSKETRKNPDGETGIRIDCGTDRSTVCRQVW